MEDILTNPATHFNCLAHVSAEDLTTEISTLEAQVAIQRDDLRDLEQAHKARPYRPAFMVRMRRGYRSSLRELHSQIAAVRVALRANASLQR